MTDNRDNRERKTEGATDSADILQVQACQDHTCCQQAPDDADKRSPAFRGGLEPVGPEGYGALGKGPNSSACRQKGMNALGGRKPRR